MLRLAALLAAVAVHPAAVPDFVTWQTHLWDAYALARGGFRVAVDGRFAISAACDTVVVAQKPAPRSAVARGTVLHLRAAATCRKPVRPAATPAPELVGLNVTAAVARLRQSAAAWMIVFPALPPSRSQYLYDAYRIASERLDDGVLHLDAALVPAVVKESCPVFGLDTSSTRHRAASAHRLRRSAVTATARTAAQPYVSSPLPQPPGPLRVTASSAERVGSCVEWVANIVGHGLDRFDLPFPRQIPFAVGPVPTPFASLRVVIDDATARVLAVEGVDG